MPDDFTFLVEQYADTVTKLCFLQLKNRADAEDVWQNVFMKLYKTPKMWNKPGDELRKWIVTVTLNECRDCKRKLFHRMHDDIDSIQIATEQPLESTVFEQVRQLPSVYARPILLFYFEGYSVREIADLLSTKENTVKSRLKRGRELLKGVLNDE